MQAADVPRKFVSTTSGRVPGASGWACRATRWPSPSSALAPTAADQGQVRPRRERPVQPLSTPRPRLHAPGPQAVPHRAQTKRMGCPAVAMTMATPQQRKLPSLRVLVTAEVLGSSAPTPTKSRAPWWQPRATQWVCLELWKQESNKIGSRLTASGLSVVKVHR